MDFYYTKNDRFSDWYFLQNWINIRQSKLYFSEKKTWTLYEENNYCKTLDIADDLSSAAH